MRTDAEREERAIWKLSKEALQCDVRALATLGVCAGPPKKVQ